MARTRRKRHQPRVKGGRDPLATCVLPDIALALQRIANKHGVGVSWVLAVIAGDKLGINVASYLDKRDDHDKRSR